MRRCDRFRTAGRQALDLAVVAVKEKRWSDVRKHLGDASYFFAELHFMEDFAELLCEPAYVADTNR